jgi:serine/threonine protein kinase
LKRIESHAFRDTKISSLELPPTIVFIASYAFSPSCRLSLAERCPSFEKWNIVRLADPQASFERSASLTRLLVDLTLFERVEMLGRGATGAVWLYRRGELEIAVKSMPLAQEAVPFHEIEALLALAHPCVVPLLGFALGEPDDPPKLVMLHARGGSLQGAIAGRPDWWTATAKAKAIAVVGIVLGMIFVHDSGVMHRDLKPSNILLDEQHRVLIADFGSSRFETLTRELTMGVGTIMYIAPELCEEQTVYTNSIDVFAFALIFYEILVGEAVFPAKLTALQIANRLQKGVRAAIPGSIPQFVRQLIEAGWAQGPETRPSFREIFEVLEENNFAITDGVDTDAVRAYVQWVAKEAEE